MRVTLCHDVVLVELEGDVGRECVAPLMLLFDRCLEMGQTKIVLSLKGAGHIHYHLAWGLGSLQAAWRRMSGDIKFASASPYHLTIFDAMGLGDRLTMTPSVEEALLEFCDRRWGH